MNIYQKVSVVLALSLYLPLGYQILTGKVTQNLATWILWILLDVIAAGSMFVQDGNFELPTAYVVGGTCIIVCIAKMKTMKWTMYETKVSCMVVACMIGWGLSGPWLATILSSSAMALATIPQLKDCWRQPDQTPTLVYVGYTVANLASTIGGKSWTVEERFYPIVCMIICMLMVTLSLQIFTESSLRTTSSVPSIRP